MESKLILYHSNRDEECQKFISQKDYLILSTNSKDDIWLGKGMYFWDNRGNVNWWNIKQKKRNQTEKFRIVLANVKLDKLLDLTDYEVYTAMERLWVGFCNKTKMKKDIPLGNKLNCLFEAFKFNLYYSVIKVYGKYNGVPSDGLFKFDYKSTKQEPTMAVKCIYSVRNSEAIAERDIED